MLYLTPGFQQVPTPKTGGKQRCNRRRFTIREKVALVRFVKRRVVAGKSNGDEVNNMHEWDGEENIEEEDDSDMHESNGDDMHKKDGEENNK
jgi:hypothetical protein